MLKISPGVERAQRALLLSVFTAALFLIAACGTEKPATANTTSSLNAAPVGVASASQATEPVSIAAVGDIMLGSSFPNASGLPPKDGADLLTEVAPILTRADLAFGNLEGPMLEGGASAKCAPNSTKCFAFRVPTRYGRYLKEAGLDVMNLANNHSSDFGREGVESSKRVLRELGMAHTAEEGDVARLNIKGRKIIVVGFATNNVSYNLNDIDKARRVVSDLARQADILIVSFHGGAEGTAAQHVPHGRELYLGEERGDLRTFTHAVVDSGADLVLGHGPHVVRGMEVYKDRLIAYSLGNFATYGKFNLTGALGLTMVLEAELKPDGAFLGGRIHPATQTKPGGPHLDSAGQIIPVVRQLSQADFGQTAVKVDADGRLTRQ